MPIVSNDIIFRLSGGASNTVAQASRGGAMSTVGGGIITDNSLNNLFPDVTGPQSTAGADHYRCIYVVNNHGSLTLTNAKIWIADLTASNDDEVDIGLDPAAVGSNSGISVNETDTGTDTPSGVDFFRVTSPGTALTIGNIPNGSKKAFWIKRSVNAGAAAFTDNFFRIQVSGETLD